MHTNIHLKFERSIASRIPLDAGGDWGTLYVLYSEGWETYDIEGDYDSIVALDCPGELSYHGLDEDENSVMYMYDYTEADETIENFALITIRKPKEYMNVEFHESFSPGYGFSYDLYVFYDPSDGEFYPLSGTTYETLEVLYCPGFLTLVRIDIEGEDAIGCYYTYTEAGQTSPEIYLQLREL